MGKLTHRTAPGCSYFVTTKTWQNRELFRVSENAEILVQCILGYRNRGAYQLHEFVVMPNHLHLLLTPADDTSLEKAMQLIKGGILMRFTGNAAIKCRYGSRAFMNRRCAILMIFKGGGCTFTTIL